MSVIIKSNIQTNNVNLPIYKLDPIIDDNTLLLFDARRITGSSPLGDNQDLPDLSDNGNLRTNGSSLAFVTTDPAYISLDNNEILEMIDGDSGNANSDFGIGGSTKGVLLITWVKFKTLGRGLVMQMVGDDLGNSYQDSIMLWNVVTGVIRMSIGGSIFSDWAVSTDTWYQVAMWGKPGLTPKVFINNVEGPTTGSVIAASWNTTATQPNLPGDWQYGIEDMDIGRVVLQVEQAAGSLDLDDAQSVIAADWNAFKSKYGLS